MNCPVQWLIPSEYTRLVSRPVHARSQRPWRPSESTGLPMPTVRHLENAPITEALVDFRVNARKDFRAEEFRSLKEQLRAVYPNVEERRGLEASFEFKPGLPITTMQREVGLQSLFFRSADNLNVAQFRIDGFTHNRLKPYTSWEALLPEAVRLWELYVKVAKPEYVTRLALRYINHLRLPTNVDGLGRFLATAPALPAGYPSHVRGFLTRFEVTDRETEIAANVAQALDAPSVDGVTVILDIDVYKEEHFDVGDARIPEVLATLRSLKNRIFFDTLTEQGIGLFV